MTGRLLRKREDNKWEYILTEEARAEVGFDTMEAYIRKRQNTVVWYISTQSLLDICEATEMTQGARVGMQLWEQAGIDLAGAMEVAAAEAESYKDGMEE